jgi:hypothetical protein
MTWLETCCPAVQGVQACMYDAQLTQIMAIEAIHPCTPVICTALLVALSDCQGPGYVTALQLL